MRAQRMVQAMAIAGLLLVPASVGAQLGVGGLAGVVRDTTGAVLPGATVEAASSCPHRGGPRRRHGQPGPIQDH